MGLIHQGFKVQIYGFWVINLCASLRRFGKWIKSLELLLFTNVSFVGGKTWCALQHKVEVPDCIDVVHVCEIRSDGLAQAKTEIENAFVHRPHLRCAAWTTSIRFVIDLTIKLHRNTFGMLSICLTNAGPGVSFSSLSKWDLW